MTSLVFDQNVMSVWGCAETFCVDKLNILSVSLSMFDVVIQVKVVLKKTLKLIVTKSLSVYMMTSQGRLYVTDGLLLRYTFECFIYMLYYTIYIIRFMAVQRLATSNNYNWQLSIMSRSACSISLLLLARASHAYSLIPSHPPFLKDKANTKAIRKCHSYENTKSVVFAKFIRGRSQRIWPDAWQRGQTLSSA